MADKFSDSPRENFEKLWKILDENYCFFEYKGVDWNEVYQEYSLRIHEEMHSYQLFNILGDMLGELQDGHTNLITSIGVSAYDLWYKGYPVNYDPSLIYDYLSPKYIFTDALQYSQIIGGRLGYIYCGSFSIRATESELDNMFTYFDNCEALVIDVRDNGGGSLTHSDRLVSRFIQEKTLFGYIQHKTGKGHADLSEPYPMYLSPSHRISWNKPVVVLTNRYCYSAANNFVSKMKTLPHVTIIGDSTGGGSGLPFTSELPNGWSVRFSASPILDVNKQHTEFGIEPDIKVSLKEEEREQRIESILKVAIYHLLGIDYLPVKSQQN